MREVILSADGDSTVYLVPDAVAEHLKKYCLNSARSGCMRARTPGNTGCADISATRKRISSTG